MKHEQPTKLLFVADESERSIAMLYIPELVRQNVKDMNDILVKNSDDYEKAMDDPQSTLISSYHSIMGIMVQYIEMGRKSILANDTPPDVLPILRAYYGTMIIQVIHHLKDLSDLLSEGDQKLAIALLEQTIYNIENRRNYDSPKD